MNCCETRNNLLQILTDIEELYYFGTKCTVIYQLNDFDPYRKSPIDTVEYVNFRTWGQLFWPGSVFIDSCKLLKTNNIGESFIKVLKSNWHFANNYESRKKQCGIDVAKWNNEFRNRNKRTLTSGM